MRIGVLVLDDVFDTGLAAILDTFDTANALASDAERAGPPFAVSAVGVRRRARTHHGMQVPLVAHAGAPRPEVVVVPALGAKTPATLAEALGRRDVADACCALLRRLGRRGSAARRVLHRDLPPRGGRPARRPLRDDDLVARADVP